MYPICNVLKWRILSIHCITTAPKEANVTKTVLNIKHWGNNLGVRLPAAVACAAHFHADQRVRVSVKKCCVFIAPLLNETLTLKQRLARFDRTRHSGEAMASNSLGAEQW